MDNNGKNFSFTVGTQKSAEKALYTSMISAAGAAAAVLFGTTGGIAGSAIGAGLSSIASDCIEQNYAKFGSTGYGTVVAGRYGAKLRIAIYIYTDANRTVRVYSDVCSTDHFPI